MSGIMKKMKGKFWNSNSGKWTKETQWKPSHGIVGVIRSKPQDSPYWPSPEAKAKDQSS